MPSIYIHVPFCKQACIYCDFHFSTQLKNKALFLKALHKEIALRQNYLERKSISTIYFGGGTPSLLNKKEISEIFDTLNKYYNIQSDAEITLEANPDDLTKSKIIELKSTPVNRLSIGVQSFFNHHLKLMNRAHQSEQAIETIKCAKDAGFNNITIDLIYGIPGMSNERWVENIQKAIAQNVNHISAYCLTNESKTQLHHLVKQGKLAMPDENECVEQFNTLANTLEKNNFIQYEISNFGKEGFFSQHNSNYWLKSSYIGLGPSAHSYNQTSRQWNISNNTLYIQSLEKGELLFEKEILTENQKFNEYVLTRLRTIWGIDLDEMESLFGSEKTNQLIHLSGVYFNSSDLQKEKNKVILTQKGKMIADKISSDLFIV